MRRLHLLIAVALVSAAICAGADTGPDKPCRMAVDLVDGSSIIGSFNERSLPFHTAFAKLSIIAANIRSLKPAGDNERFQLLLANGDSLTVVPDFASLSIVTLIGPVTIKMSHITRIESFAAGVSREGLVAEYLFNGDANDTSTNGCNGTVHDATLTEDRFGRKNMAYLFSGDGQWIDIRDSVLSKAMDALTLSMWARPDALPGEFEMVLISKQPSGTCSMNPSPTTDNHGGLFDFRLGIGVLHLSTQRSPGMNSEGFSADIKSFEVNRWFHFAVTVDSATRRIDFYVNGELAGSRTANDAPLKFPTTEPLRIGMRKDSPYRKSYFKGALDDITIFNRSLTAEEIKRLYRSEP